LGERRRPAGATTTIKEDFMDRTANAVWQGNLKEGKGTLDTQSGTLKGTPYSFKARFEDESDARSLCPGDWLDIAPHRRHRVDWTDPAVPTIWLAVFYR